MKQKVLISFHECEVNVSDNFIFSFHNGLKKSAAKILTYFNLIEMREENINVSTRELTKRLT